MNDDLDALSHFAGRARLFPLPNLVLFPHVVQPLHVFEPRYRSLTADALGDDRLISMALLKPGGRRSTTSGRRFTPSCASEKSSRRSGWPTGATTSCCTARPA